MYSRDLPLWARGAVALVLIVIGWYAGHTALLVEILGDSVVEISAGAVALGVVVVWKIPVAWWPAAPARPRFSAGITIGTAVVLAAGLAAGAGSGLPARFWATGRGAIAVVVAGSAVLALGLGRVRLELFARWFGLAVLFGAATIGAGAVLAAAGGQLPPLRAGAFASAFSFGLVMSTAATLVTMEFAFRRLLVGQSGEAGMGVVLAAAIAATAWQATIPIAEFTGLGVAGAFFNAVALGSLYVLSRALLVSAVFHGVQVGLLVALGAADGMALGLGRRFWTGHVIGAGLVAIVLAYYVFRQNGWVGVPPQEPVPADAADD